MANNFDVGNFINPLIQNMWNPGTFQDQTGISEGDFMKPYQVAFQQLMPMMQQSFNYNTLDPFNRDALNHTINYQNSNASNGNWRTGDYARGESNLNADISQQRNSLLEGYFNNVQNQQDQVNNFGRNQYTQEENNNYLSPTFFMKNGQPNFSNLGTNYNTNV